MICGRLTLINDAHLTPIQLGSRLYFALDAQHQPSPSRRRTDCGALNPKRHRAEAAGDVEGEQRIESWSLEWPQHLGCILDQHFLKGLIECQHLQTRANSRRLGGSAES